MGSRVLTALLSNRSAADALREHSFERIYGEYIDFVWRSARRLGVSEAAADDVAQQVFLVVHRRVGEFEGRSTLKTWILSILLRVVRDHNRSVRRKSPHLLHEPVDPDGVADTGSNPHEALSRAEAIQVLDEILESLDEDKRVVFVLTEVEQMTAREIGEATGLTPEAVYSRLRAARTDVERAASRLRRKPSKAQR